VSVGDRRGSRTGVEGIDVLPGAGEHQHVQALDLRGAPVCEDAIEGAVAVGAGMHPTLRLIDGEHVPVALAEGEGGCALPVVPESVDPVQSARMPGVDEEREWQSGDLLRTRRNNRSLPLGESHVRNGDRFRVLGIGPTGTGSGTAGEPGLVVEDLNGRGRTILPAQYLAKHCEYGWASTIDSAQGATADLGIVLVRPGMDREHLYVAMTRGRLGNHAYVTPDATVDDEHDDGHPFQQHPPGHAGVEGSLRAHEPTPEQQALRALEAALATSGAQDAAHTALQQARVQAGKDTRRAQHDQAYEAERERHQAREQAQQELPEHRAAREQLQQVQTQRGRLSQDQTQRQWSLRLDQAELDRIPRRAIRHRRDLTERVTQVREAVSKSDLRLEALDGQISDLTRQLRGHEQDRQDRIEQQRWTRPAPKPADPLGYLEPSRSVRMAIQASQVAQISQLSRLSQPDVAYRAPGRGGPSRSR
jgi:hypothetical protein